MTMEPQGGIVLGWSWVQYVQQHNIRHVPRLYSLLERLLYLHDLPDTAAKDSLVVAVTIRWTGDCQSMKRPSDGYCSSDVGENAYQIVQDAGF